MHLCLRLGVYGQCWQSEVCGNLQRSKRANTQARKMKTPSSKAQRDFTSRLHNPLCLCHCITFSLSICVTLGLSKANRELNVEGRCEQRWANCQFSLEAWSCEWQAGISKAGIFNILLAFVRKIESGSDLTCYPLTTCGTMHEKRELKKKVFRCGVITNWKGVILR